ncbi:hypothetical protein BOTCAL_0419g00050 [Botryotinia calthae]|uniref:J domain-containing protein n=1 Tax=Botryotinia calthae TaxID=38488 RepID=A0A4Y8CRZ6_9HELO|nr:hypothetical protein BOTCAL_0419g00050 [Botryotinia calthae]
MAAPRRQRSYLPSPPASPSEQKPRPLPLPTETARYKTWQIARSSSVDVKSVPVPSLAHRSATAPVIGTTSDQFKDYDRSSSTEPKTVPESVVEPEVPSRYTTSYYHILGLPESSDVTTKEIEEAYQNLVSNPSSHPSHGYENLEQIRKTLTSSIRRRTYDRGRRAHSLQESQLNNRERFEKLNNDFDKISKAQKTTQNIKSFTENVEMKRLESELRMVKKEVAATIKREVKVMGLSMSLDGLDEEEGVPWEEMDFGTKSSQIVGERLGLEFEFNESGGSEDDSGDENGSAGTFSDREEERRHPRMSEESEQIKRLEEFEELPVSTMTGFFSIPSSSELEKAPIAPERTSKDDQEKLDVKDERLPASEEAAPFTQAYSSVKTAPTLLKMISKSDEEKTDIKDKNDKILNIPEMNPEIMPKSEFNKEPMGMKAETQEILETTDSSINPTPTTSPPPIQTDLPDIPTIVELLYPTPPPTPKSKPKKKKISHKEIWEFDYNSDSDADTECDSDSNSNYEFYPEEPKVLRSSAPPTKTPELHELPGSEIWEFDYPNTNTNTNPKASSSSNTQNEEDEEERHETLILFLQFLIVFSLATAAWGWIGGGWVLNLALNLG